MISVFSENNSERLKYVLNFCFADKGFDYKIVTSREEWSKVKYFRINYSSLNVDAEHSISPCGILFSKGAGENHIISSFDQEFLIDGIKDDLGIIFWLLTRYEEYNLNHLDEHKRYLATNSAAVRLNFLRKPLADILCKEIWEKIGLDYNIVKNGCELIPSFDIDVAWAYKNRKLTRKIGAVIKHGNLSQRVKVWLGKEKDPYDTYDYIHEISTKVNRIICFALLGDWSKFDKNIHWKNDNYQSLLRSLNTLGGMGIHPSYDSYLNTGKIEEEISRLEKIVGHEVVKSRQHFLRLNFPKTYECLVECGIQRDFTMGYSDEVGFRAGTSFPYKFYNLRTDKITNLLIFPFVYMDSALKDQLKLSAEESKNLINKLADEVKDVGGIFMCVWHNSSINNLGEWEGWKDVLDFTVSLFEKKQDSVFDDEFL